MLFITSGEKVKFSLCLRIRRITQKTFNRFHKIRWKTVVHGKRKKPLDFGGNPDHITLGLQLTLCVVVGRTVLQLDEGRVPPHN